MLSALLLGAAALLAEPAARFDDDLAFLRTHTEVVVLGEAGGPRVAVVPAWQGRVVTSTVGGASAPSYGWINRELVASGKLQPHMNAFGGEDRIWLGPEGGQYSIFFEPGAAFDLEHWQTPPLVDSEAWPVAERGPRHVTLRAEGRLVNYSGTRFELRIERTVRLLERDAAARALGASRLPGSLRIVGFESENVLVNTGAAAWTKPQGLLSIWILGMFQPSPRTTVVIPYREGAEAQLGPVVNDAYFGKVPADRLVAVDGRLFFKGDGERRGKIGLSTARAKGILGSYDAALGVLTIVRYSQAEGATDYVNSMWEIQQQPYRGDVVNSYNDGPPAPGAAPLGPFYELETSSPAAALRPGERLRHVHRTFHLQGERADLDALARALLGASIQEIESALPGEPQWPPAVRPDETGGKALSAEESLATIVVPPGYRVELVAKEPLVEDPILIDFDALGRMWVVEMPAFAVDATMRDSREPICRVVVLEDVDDDGAMDRRTVFADRLVLPRALKTLERGVLVGEPPYLWLMRDRDGDLRADERELVSDSFGQRDANPEHNANSLIWGLDNWLYTSEHDWHLRFRKGAFEVMPTLARGQWGGSIDDAGRVYRNFNDSPLHVDLLPARYFTRNPNLVRTRGLYEPLLSLEQAVAWPIRPTRGVNRGYRDQFFRPDGSSRILQSGATPVVFRGDRLPEQLRGGVFVTDSTTNLLHWLVVEDDGTGRLSARNGFERGEIFASRDERLRPVSAASGPDGTLYVVDMYRGVVQDVAYQTEYLQDYIRRRGLATPVHLGRIYRIAHEAFPRGRRPALSRESSSGLVAQLSHPNGWWRDTAQQLLVQRQDASVVPALRELSLTAPDWRARLHALGVLDGLGALDALILEPLLAHEHPDVRAWALRWSERWLAEPGHPLAAAALRLVSDPSFTVRRQLAASIGELPEPARLAAALLVLGRHGGDPITVDAVISGLAGLETAAVERLLQASPGPEAGDAVAMLAGAVARSGRAEPVERLLDRAGDDTQARWQRLALLRGVELGLGGRDVRGGPRRAAQRPRTLTLPGEPTSLTRMRAGTDELAALARGLVTRLEWPGKPVPRVEPPRQTAEEQARFEAGRGVYQALCIACHQADGAGGDQAPSLVESPLVTGDPGVPIRVVLAGKEGDVGLMPPVSMLPDDDLAAVLTYIRWEWGNNASSVGPEEVREIRGLTASRTRPWTREELARP